MVIHCTNPTCRTWVSQPLGRCPACQTPLPYRLLLAVGDGLPKEVEATLISGTRVAQRYMVWKHPVWLDTRPEDPIASVDPIPPRVLPYLHLSGFIQHIPRPYDYLTGAASGLGVDVLLLEASPLAVTLPPSPSDPVQVQRLPLMGQAWAEGTALQQLNWLRQIAYLWPALAEQRVATTLITPETLRVDQSLLRITRLVPDAPQSPALAALGRQWKPLASKAQPVLRDYLGWLTAALARGELVSASALLAELEQAIQTLATGLTVTVEWAAETDQGLSRDRNEDACYPQGKGHKQVISGVAASQKSGLALPLLVVCDGIGGHEQGNVASQTAIQTFLTTLQPLAQQGDLSPATVAQGLRQAMVEVNTNIVNRNNDEHRSERARMGTTAVLALVHFPYVSVAHLGDSRAYRVSAHTAYQITLDDDVASREARLGYALYQEATHMAGGGALVQALGINDSEYLYPTVQHFLLDDPCVLLLCSDGLSDYDRVETLWPHTVAPLVGQAAPLEPAIQSLIQWANQLNGHDNITVGLMRFLPQPLRVASPLPAAALAPSVPPNSGSTLLAQPTRGTFSDRPTPPGASSPEFGPGDDLIPATEVAALPQSTPRWPWRAFLAGAVPTLLLLAVGGWAYTRWQPKPLPLAALPPWPSDLQAEVFQDLAPAKSLDIAVGSFWQRSVAWENSGDPDPLALRPNPTASVPNNLPTIPVGSILKVVDRRGLSDQPQWVYLQVCAIPSGGSLAPVPPASGSSSVGAGSASSTEARLATPLAQPGRQGWVRSQALSTNATPLTGVSPSQRGICTLP
ncbi:MAG: PP2C family protein-serine/threonine phosphatase [Spirulina sp.]